MSRAPALFVLLASAACGPAPRPISPVATPPAAEGLVVTPAPAPQPGVTYEFLGPGIGRSEGMSVAVPDTTALERMPVLRPDTTIDRGMVARGGGIRFRIRGPTNVAPGPPLDSVLRIAPLP